MKNKDWFELNHPDEIDSPALMVYKDRIEFNIQTMIQIAGTSERLLPHVKTHKMAQIVHMQISAGISKFKKRKKETLKKLEDTDADLERVEDLLFEIEKNMKSLEKQAKQTERLTTLYH